MHVIFLYVYILRHEDYNVRSDHEHDWDIGVLMRHLTEFR